MARSKRLLQASTRVIDANSGGIIPISHWARFVNHDAAGLGDYSDYAGSSDIVADADGYYPAGDRYRIIVDISNAMSSIIGKQCPMTANYRLKSLGISIRPVDDWLDNNATPVTFAGQVKYLLPNKHNIDAIQAARQLERMAESIDIDGDSWLIESDQQDYKGFRFGWRTELDVAHPTAEAFSPGSAAEGGTPSWMLYDDDGALGMMDLWRVYKDHNPEQGNALWLHREGTASEFQWAAGWGDGGGDSSLLPSTNSMVQPTTPGDFRITAGADNHIEVLGGLMAIDFTHSSMLSTVFINNEYHVYVDVEVEGWEAF